MNFDGFYFYNPFAELRWTDVEDADDEGGESPDYERLIAFTRETLNKARPGTRVVTYHGFGGAHARLLSVGLQGADGIGLSRALGEVSFGYQGSEARGGPSCDRIASSNIQPQVGRRNTVTHPSASLAPMEANAST